MSTVTAKFRCDSVVQHGDFTLVSLSADFSGNYFDPSVDHPNKKFWDATPCGHMEMTITNPTAAGAFERGTIYTLTFERDGAQEVSTFKPQGAS